MHWFRFSLGWNLQPLLRFLPTYLQADWPSDLLSEFEAGRVVLSDTTGRPLRRCGGGTRLAAGPYLGWWHRACTRP